MITDPRTLRSDEPLAIELTTAVKQGEIERLNQLLAEDAGLARCVIEAPKGGGRTPLHIFADWPGHNPNAAALVRTLAAAGADLNAPAVRMWHRETPLHWAASNDFVLSRRLRSMGSGAAVGRARRPNPSPARSGAGITSGDYAPRGSLPITAS
jgi:ankyrin repeat protein